MRSPITLLKPQTGDIPLPIPTPLSQPFWDGCVAGELRFQRCRQCQRANFNPVLRCRYCLSSELDWQVSAGRGTIYSWTTAHRGAVPGFITPYTAIIVDVAEGYQMLSNLVGCDEDDVAVGLHVAVDFHRVSDAIVLPYFALVPG